MSIDKAHLAHPEMQASQPAPADMRKPEDGGTLSKWKAAALSAGVCPTCALGAPDTFGCSDCLNTGWVQGAPPGYVAETTIAERDRRIADLEAGLKPFRTDARYRFSDMERVDALLSGQQDTATEKQE